MRTHLSRIANIVMIFVMLAGTVGLATPAAAAGSGPTVTITAPQQDGGAIRVVSPSAMGRIESLAALQARQITSAEIERAAQVREQTSRALPRPEGVTNALTDPSIVQNSPVGKNMPAAIANFEGVNNVSGVLPPDTNGDIGADPGTGTKYYVQWVNLALQMWDVTNPAAPTALLASPLPGNQVFTSLGGICAANNDGDPIVLFDSLASRWMISQFALGFPNNFHQCIAVSQTANPAGGWYLYDFQTSTTLMNDYPHFGVWPDGYYMTVNQFDGASFAWAGAGVAVFERSQMLDGLPARMIYIDTGAVTLNYGGMLPSDLDGPAPAAGTPNYFMEWDDSTWLGDAADTLRIWNFHVDWTTPANTTFGADASYTPDLMVITSNVDPTVCASRNCIPQPGTTQGLDGIADRLMHRLQYRNFGTYETLVGNHTVDADGTNHAGIHWFELRNTGAGFTLHQDGVYAPDTDHRWMGSAAMDYSGDIALGYSVSSGTTYPSIRYTGRLPGDTLGTLPQGESTLIAGTGSQTHSAARWGDYSMLGLDPADDCTFWYTQEYYATTSSAGWQTRIGSFKFPSCTTAPTGVLSGTVMDSASAPIAGATVAASGGYTTVTDAAGHYTFDLVDGTYSVTASKYGYVSGNAPAVVVTPPDTTTQDFTLGAAPVYTVTLNAHDVATTWPLYTQVSISGYPGGPVFTDPVTGSGSVDLVAGTYTFTFHALSGGYADVAGTIPVSGNMTISALMDADLVSCTAPGYQPGSVAWSEGFEGAFLPAGWTKYQSGATGFTQGTTATVGSHGSAHTGTYYAWHNDDFGAQDSWLVTPQFAVPAGGGSLAFWQRGYWSAYYTFHEVAITTGASPDPGVSTYTQLYTGNVAVDNVWEQTAVDLSAYAGQNVYLAFHYQGDFSDEWYLDDVQAQQPCHPMAGAGLVVGSVYDANTALALAGASVTDGVAPALWFDNAADTSRPATYVIGEPAGAVSLTASAAGYTSSTQSPTVVAGGVIRQDFNLAAGSLSAAPTSLAYTVAVPAPTASQPLTLSNTGGAAAAYQVFAVPGVFAGYTPTGPFAPNTRHTGPKNLNDLDSSALRMDFTPQNVPLINGGAVSASWPTGLAYAWGIGFNTDANDLWLGNILAGGGDDLNYRFTTLGVNTGDTIDTTPWVGTFGGDMTYNPFTKTLWQVNVGGDNCIYELDPAAMISTGNRICPAFGTPQRGLAFDPLTNTYYSGSWTDGILNHFAPDGTMLASVNVGLNIAGLAFNPSTHHLFVLINGTGQPDVYVLDTATATYDIVGAFYVKDGATKVFAAGGQAGLEMDCAGNLWAVNQSTQIVYSAASGETGVCDWQASWLSVTPAAGSVAAAGNSVVAANVDATGLTAGTYQAYLRIVSDTPYGDEIVPVTLVVVNGFYYYLPLVNK